MKKQQEHCRHHKKGSLDQKNHDAKKYGHANSIGDSTERQIHRHRHIGDHLKTTSTVLKNLLVRTRFVILMQIQPVSTTHAILQRVCSKRLNVGNATDLRLERGCKV